MAVVHSQGNHGGAYKNVEQLVAVGSQDEMVGSIGHDDILHGLVSPTPVHQ